MSSSPAGADAKGTSVEASRASVSRSRALNQPPHRTLWTDALHAFLRNKMAVVGLAIVTIFAVVAIAAPVVAVTPPTTMNYAEAFSSPSLSHPFGTDSLGRDVYSRIVFGARYALGLAIVTVVITASAGLLIGVSAAYFGRWVDTLLMRFVDVLLGFPTFVLALALVAFIGPSTVNIVFVLAISHAPKYARLVRGSVLRILQQDYIEAARAIGASHSVIIRRHLLPNSLSSTIVYSSLDLGLIIVALAGLSFLGVGIQPPNPDWGLMLSDARANLSIAPWSAIFPGLAISIVVVGFNFIGDGLRDALDPRMRT